MEHLTLKVLQKTSDEPTCLDFMITLLKLLYLISLSWMAALSNYLIHRLCGTMSSCSLRNRRNSHRTSYLCYFSALFVYFLLFADLVEMRISTSTAWYPSIWLNSFSSFYFIQVACLVLHFKYQYCSFLGMCIKLITGFHSYALISFFQATFYPLLHVVIVYWCIANSALFVLYTFF